MGICPIRCPVCDSPFMWFSGDVRDQRCERCKIGQQTKLKKEEISATKNRLEELKSAHRLMGELIKELEDVAK